MKRITKIAAGALVACGLAVAVAAPADAGVRIGIGLPFPVVAATAPATCYDAYGNAFYCGYQNYNAPGYVGFSLGGHRDWHGDRDFHRDHDGRR